MTSVNCQLSFFMPFLCWTNLDVILSCTNALDQIS